MLSHLFLFKPSFCILKYHILSLLNNINIMYIKYGYSNNNCLL